MKMVENEKLKENNDDIQVLGFENDYNETDKIMLEVSQFVRKNKVNLINIEENVYFSKEKVLMSRIILYYDNNIIIEQFNNNPVLKINLIEEKNRLHLLLNKFNKFKNKNENLNLLSLNSNHFIEKNILMVRLTAFFQKK